MAEHRLNKRLVSSIFISVFLLSSIFPAMTLASSNNVATVYLNPATVTATSVGQNFTVKVCVANVTDLFTFCCGMTWDPEALECVEFKEGPFLSEGVLWQDYITVSDPTWINNTAGEIYPPYAISRTWIGLAVTGSGTLYIAKFTAKKTGTFNVHPAEVVLINSEVDRIPANILDVFTVVQDENVYPIVTVSNLTGRELDPPRTRIYNYGFNQTADAISFAVKGEHGQTGFCNVTIPNDLVEDAPPECWVVLIDGSEVTATVSQNATHTSVYFTYTLSSHDVVIKAGALEPTADFTFSPLFPVINQNVTFNASASTPSEAIISYAWDFGDGSNVTEADPITTHNYTAAGTYNVTLNVTDNQGLWNTTTETIKVSTLAVTDFTITLPFGASAIYPGRATHPYWGYWGSTYPWGAYPEKWRQIRINVTVENRGAENENFTVTTYYDSHVVHDYYGDDTQNVTNLAPGENITLTFCWDTTDVYTCPIVYPQGYSKAGYYIPYSISVNISHPTLGDIKAEGGQVTARMAGDYNGDGHCKGADFTILGMAWWTVYPDPYYDPRADLSGDGDVKGEDFNILAMFWCEY